MEGWGSPSIEKLLEEGKNQGIDIRVVEPDKIDIIVTQKEQTEI